MAGQNFSKNIFHFLKLRLLESLLFVFATPCALAEYRVYQYVVHAKQGKTNNITAKIVETPLPPQSYRTYYGSEQIVSLEVLNTWMCMGHTGQLRPPCSSPYNQLKMDDVKAASAQAPLK